MFQTTNQMMIDQLTRGVSHMARLPLSLDQFFEVTREDNHVGMDR